VALTYGRFLLLFLNRWLTVDDIGNNSIYSLFFSSLVDFI